MKALSDLKCVCFFCFEIYNNQINAKEIFYKNHNKIVEYFFKLFLA